MISSLIMISFRTHHVSYLKVRNRGGQTDSKVTVIVVPQCLPGTWYMYTAWYRMIHCLVSYVHCLVSDDLMPGIIVILRLYYVRICLC